MGGAITCNGEGMEEEEKGDQISIHPTRGPLQLFRRGCAHGNQDDLSTRKLPPIEDRGQTDRVTILATITLDL